MRFKYTAYSYDAGVIRGAIEAANVAEVITEIKRSGLKVLRVKDSEGSSFIRALQPKSKKVTSKEMILFARQLATMLSSGAGILQSLHMLEAESGNDYFRDIIASISREIENGKNFSTALGEYPKIFDQVFVSVIEVGEYTGALPPALRHLATTRERASEAKKRALRTITYPTAIIGLSLVTMGVLMTVALPPLLKVFDKLGADLPVATRVAIGSMVWIKSNFLVVLYGHMIAVGSLIALGKFEKTRMVRDHTLLHLPMIGHFIMARELAKFSQSMTMLLESQVSLVTALSLSTSGIGNSAIKDALQASEDSLMVGGGLVEPLKNSGVFPTLFIELMAIGEESNSLKSTLSEAGDTYQQQLEDQLNSMMAVLEPISTVVVGGIVGFIAFSMFLPIYSGLSAV